MNLNKRDLGPESRSKEWNLMGLGLQLTGTVLLFLLAGWGLDRYFGWSPWGLAGCGLAGVGLGLFQLVKAAQ